MAQKLTKVAEVTDLESTDTIVVIDESVQNPDGSSGAVRRIKRTNMDKAEYITVNGVKYPITSITKTTVGTKNLPSLVIAYDDGEGSTIVLPDATAMGIVSEDIYSEVRTKVSGIKLNGVSQDKDASGVVDITAVTPSQMTEAINTEVNNRNTAIDEALSDYAKVDGYYEEMAVGSAEQLLSSQFVEDSTPYKYRTSGGSADIGNREYDEIVGGSIVWNQIAEIDAGTQTVTSNGVTFKKNGDGTITANGTASGGDAQIIAGSFTVLPQHVGILMGCPKGGSPSTYKIFCDYGNGYIPPKPAIQQGYNIIPKVYNGTTVNNLTFKPMFFDLTQMFGTQVADYIYGLEQAQSGKGVAFFKSLFPNDYYEYNAGELMSVEGLQSHNMVGFNQWDEEWEAGGYNNITGQPQAAAINIRSKNPIRVFPSTTYYAEFSSSAMVILQYDGDGNFLSGKNVIKSASGGFTTDANARFIKMYWIGTTYKNDICINLSWSGWRNGEYEPYKKHSYPLDSSLTLRGIPKLNSQNELYFDGDIYSHDGKVQRGYLAVDMGSLDWAYQTSLQVFSSNLPDGVRNANSGIHCICEKYIAVVGYSGGSGGIDDLTKDKVISVGSSWYASSSNLLVRDTAFTDASAFKTAMSGVMLIYELATPTEETAEPYTSPQAVDDFGTEEYISGNLVPVGHNTKYPANLRDKLQHLPNMADSDGAYLIRQTNKQMSLEVFRIPKAPTTDGTYTLKATVSGGTPTYIWEAVE